MSDAKLWVARSIRAGDAYFQIMMSDVDKIANCQKIHQRAIYLRGRFLNSVAVIDKDISLILTDYFCFSSEKQEFFFKEVLGAYFFSLSSKKDILFKIVKKDYPNFWDDKKTLLKSFDEIFAFRNKLAHSVVDVSEEALMRPIEKGVGFVEWKDGKPITDEEFQRWDRKASDIVSCLWSIRKLLPFKEV